MNKKEKFLKWLKRELKDFLIWCIGGIVLISLIGYVFYKFGVGL